MERKKASFWKSYQVPITLILSILAGSFLGALLGEQATVLEPFGRIFLNLIFTMVVPLVFCSVVSAVGAMANLKKLGRILGNMLLIFVSTGFVSALLMLAVVLVWPPARGVALSMATDVGLDPVSFGSAIVNSLTVSDFSGLFSRSNMLPLIFFSILFGLGVNLCGGAASPVGSFIINLNEIMMKLVNMIMYYAPIGLAAYFASMVGEFGPQLLGDYARAVLIYYPASFLYLLLLFPLYAGLAAGRLGIRQMGRFLFAPALTAFTTGSSVATIPVNLEASEKIGVPKDVRELVVPLGAALQMDGSVMTSILKISFLFGIFGMRFSGAATFFTAICVSVLCGVAMSGIPGGGLIGEILIVSLYGFPQEAFPVIAMLGFLLDPPATMVNAAGDTVAAMMVARVVEGRGWLERRLAERGE